MQSNWINIQFVIRGKRMRRRSSRLAAIKRIVASRSVDGQDKLIECLRREGFESTQATLSRDLKTLGIGKAPSAGGGYTYTLPDAKVKTDSGSTFVQDFMRGYVSLEFSGSFGLIKTLPGHAGSVAAALDHLGVREILGTIAGDDTILLVPRSGVPRARLLAALEKILPEI
jgi:transcriptional regulator of arginine metabolism